MDQAKRKDPERNNNRGGFGEGFNEVRDNDGGDGRCGVEDNGFDDGERYGVWSVCSRALKEV
ncbi:unnamed protein product, partial [Dovyalis caffra]